MVIIRLDCIAKKLHTFVSIAIEIGAIDISSSRGVFASQGACGHGWARLVSQLPLFCNTRITGITADGAQLGCGPAPGCIRLLLAFFTGSSDLGFHRTPIRQRHKTGFLCSLLVTTAGLQDKRAPFEPRGGPEMGKDKHQAGQMGLNPPPLWYGRVCRWFVFAR